METLLDNSLEKLIDALNDSSERKPEQRVYCSKCGNAITTVRDRMEVQGNYAHTFNNPDGITFHIGTFQEAWGCKNYGRGTQEHSWFPGYLWSFARCANCLEHLGWHYQTGRSTHFYGLILSRLKQTSGS